MTVHPANSKKAAIQTAAALRQAGKTCKIFQISGTYTQPGVGITSFIRYEVREVA